MLKNTETSRVFVAATRQNDGKTTVALGLIGALQRFYQRVGYIKPVGQRFVSIDANKIDEDTVLMHSVFALDSPLVDMSPIAVEGDFTKRYLETFDHGTLVSRLQSAFDRVAWEKDFVLCEGSGHAGVGSVFDLSNAQVAHQLGAKVIIVTQGGIGRPIDEVALNQALFEKAKVPIIGVILNKVLPHKLEHVTKFARRGLERRGLQLLGVIPHQPILCRPSIDLLREELAAELLNDSAGLDTLVEEVVVGAMSAKNAVKHLGPGVLMITPGDREDIILAVGAQLAGDSHGALAGMLLTGGLRPRQLVLEAVEHLPVPVLLTEKDSYRAASKVHDLTVKTRPRDQQKISVIRDIVANHVDVRKIVNSL